MSCSNCKGDILLKNVIVNANVKVSPQKNRKLKKTNVTDIQRRNFILEDLTSMLVRRCDDVWKCLFVLKLITDSKPKKIHYYSLANRVLSFVFRRVTQDSV